jgi:hypothetical protein
MPLENTMIRPKRMPQIPTNPIQIQQPAMAGDMVFGNQKGQFDAANQALNQTALGKQKEINDAVSQILQFQENRPEYSLVSASKDKNPEAMNQGKYKIDKDAIKRRLERDQNATD